MTLYMTLTMFLLGAALFLHLAARVGGKEAPIEQWFSQVPGIDLAIFYFTFAPLGIGAIISGWTGLGIALLAQISALWIWVFWHEALSSNHKTSAGNLHQTMSKINGRWRNHLAVWITAFAVPVFWGVRLAEILVYPPLTWLVRLPHYRHSDWVNVSRQKFKGLVGYDLIWCLYCDWMTGVWSLGSEMLRNVESFWCPIRFDCEKKCENCQLDFPDINNGWVAATGTMEEVTTLLDRQYSNTLEHPWFGHPQRHQS